MKPLARFWHRLTATRSLAARLALAYGLAGLLLVAGLGLGVYGLTARYLAAQLDRDLAAQADFYAAYTAATAPTDSDLAALAPQITDFFAPQAGYDVRLFSARSGLLLAATPNARGLGTLPSAAALAELKRRPALFLPASRDLADRRYTARPILAADGTLRAVVEVSRDVGDVGAFLRVLRLILGGAAALAGMAAVLVSLLLARRLTRPLGQVEAATQAIAAGDFSRRLDVTSADEIGRLTASVNRMAAELSRLDAARRDFLAKISHDLRTPLTAIKGLVVNLQDEAPAEMQAALATMDAQSDRLIRLIDELLTVARLQRGEIRLRRAATDLATVVRAAADLAALKAANMGVGLKLDLPEGLPCVSADADRIQQVVLNLIDNALRAAPAGTDVRVSARREDAAVVTRVLDSGAGVPAGLGPHVFEPYARGPGGGAGLGLTIAREIVTAHGGQIWLRDRAEGGTEAGFALPALTVA